MVQTAHQLPRARRCELLDIPRSSSYYQPQPVAKEDLLLMQLIDRIHMDKPFLGSRRIVDALVEQGHKADRKHVRRLMRLMGIQDSSWPEDLEATSAAQGIPILVTKSGDQPGQSGVVQRCDLSADGIRFSLSDSHYGLV